MWLIIYLLPDNQNFLQSQSLVRTCSVMMPYLPWPSFNKLSKVRKTYKETLMMEAKFLNASDNTMYQQVTAQEDHGLVFREAVVANFPRNVNATSWCQRVTWLLVHRHELCHLQKEEVLTFHVLQSCVNISNYNKRWDLCLKGCSSGISVVGDRNFLQ